MGEKVTQIDVSGIFEIFIFRGSNNATHGHFEEYMIYMVIVSVRNIMTPVWKDSDKP